MFDKYITFLVVCLSGRRGPAVNRVRDAALVRIQQPPRLAVFGWLFFYRTPADSAGVSCFWPGPVPYTRDPSPYTTTLRAPWCDSMAGHETSPPHGAPDAAIDWKEFPADWDERTILRACAQAVQLPEVTASIGNPKELSKDTTIGVDGVSLLVRVSWSGEGR